MYHFLHIVISLVSIILFLIMVNIFSKDDNRIRSHTVIVWCVIGIMTIVNLFLGCIYQDTTVFFVISLMSLYLAVTAYIDYITMHVYRILNYIFGLIGGMFLMLFPSKIEGQLTGVLFYFIVIIFIAGLGVIGIGDAFTLIAIIPYMIFLEFECDFLFLMILCMLIYNLIFIVFNIKNVQWSRMRLKSKAAFTPAIAVGTMMVVILHGII